MVRGRGEGGKLRFKNLKLSSFTRTVKLCNLSNIEIRGVRMSYFPSRCQHIKVNGTQCGSPALRTCKLCFFHQRSEDERAQLAADRARKTASALELPILEDANSIQLSLSQIMHRIVTGQIETRTAGVLVYLLQTA